MPADFLSKNHVYTLQVDDFSILKEPENDWFYQVLKEFVCYAPVKKSTNHTVYSPTGSSLEINLLIINWVQRMEAKLIIDILSTQGFYEIWASIFNPIERRILIFRDLA